MSIEALLQAHIDALKANTEAVNHLAKSLYGRTAGGENDSPKTGKAKVEKVDAPGLTAQEIADNEAADSKADTKLAAALAEKAAKEDAKPDVPSNIAYETVRALVLKLAGGGKREKIKAINAKHGIANLKVLLDKEDDFNTVNDQVKLVQVYADLQALEG